MVAKISIGNSLYGALAYNGEKINNAEVDELLEKGAVTMDETERNAIYARIAQITMYEDPFGAYMNLRKNVYALSDKIEGFAVNASNTMDLAHVRCRE